MSQTHTLATLDVYFDAVERGEKTFQVRLNDRLFQKGDTVILKRVHGASRYYTHNRAPLVFTIGAVLQGGQFGIDPRYCVFSLLPHEKEAQP